jgi:septal ring factor EnvC (AmiA/AmiB activator)
MIRFTIRDVLWLTVMVAMACAWHLERRDARRQQLEDRARLSAQERELKQKAAQLTMMQDVLNAARDEARKVRQQLVEFVATQEDQAKIDVGPGLFRRVATPQVVHWNE